MKLAIQTRSAITRVIISMLCGLDSAMHAILDAQVPVITYVYPQGSRAVSAGARILYASYKYYLCLK